MPLKTLLGLVLCNLIWSANPAVAKVILQDFSPSEAAWLRYTSGLITYIIAIVAMRLARKATELGAAFALPTTRRDWFWLVACGVMTFAFAPAMQLTGLASTRATDNALIIAMEPIMTVFMAWVILREKFTASHFICFGIALLGFAQLTGLTPSRIAAGLDSHLIGNLLILVSLIGEASYSSAGRKLMPKFHPMAIFGSSITIGVLVLTLLVFGPLGREGISIEHFSKISLSSALGLLWLGPLGTTASYLFWLVALSRGSVASAALTLFIQPVFGAFLGYAFLGERLTFAQSLGGLIILFALILQAWSERQLMRRT